MRLVAEILWTRLLALVACSLICLPCCGVTPTQPNIVLILADDVGQECLGCYGGESYKTSNLDHLAANGIRFRHCYSMPMCHPTRLTLLTGKYPYRFNAPWGSFPKSAESTTFASLLSDAGYATAVVGKWQLALLRDAPNHPQRLGFSHSDVFGWHEGPRYYAPMIYRNGQVREDTLGHYGPDLYVRSLIQFMKRNRQGPFLAFYSMALCHDVTDDLDKPVPHGPLGRYDSYPEMIAEMDAAVGRIVGALEALGLRERTLILFVGDNGTPSKMITRANGDQLVREPIVSTQNGRQVAGGKGSLLDTGTRVPLIANWPGTSVSGAVVDDLVDMSDFWPTVLELANISMPQGYRTDGQSFAARLTKGEPSAREWAYSEGKGRKKFFVRTSDWKLYNDGQLFDMTHDALESTPFLPGEEPAKNRSIRKQLTAALGDAPSRK